MKPLDPGEDITQILQSLRKGDKKAESHLISLVYDELHAMAAQLMRGERADHMLQPTALVNEAYIRLLARRETDWQSRAHFFGVASHVMRHILVDYARQRLSGKRGLGIPSLAIDETLAVPAGRLEELLALEDALQKLEAEDPRATQVVVFRFYGGLTVEEIAEVMKLSPRTVKRDWQYGRAWLKTELGPRKANAAPGFQPH
jgi:RNA polymerase sigma-70 factor, ECF subfamily